MHTPNSAASSNSQDTNFWNIDQLAVIDPKDIDETSGYLRTFQMLSPNKERVQVESIKKFFQANAYIFQSPSPNRESSHYTPLSADSRHKKVVTWGVGRL